MTSEIPEDVHTAAFNAVCVVEGDKETANLAAVMRVAEAINAERWRCAEAAREALATAGYSTDAGHGRAVINAICDPA